MTKLKSKEIKSMSKDDKERKIKELKVELIKSKASVGKGGKSNSKQIRKTIARILTVR
jgi:ribosomal protein L29